jgi:hypothetical protein
MTKKEEIEAILDLFTQPGWKYIVEDIDNIRNSYDTISNLDDLLELGRRQGRVEQIGFFMNLQDWYNNALTLIEDEDA